ncbi:ion transporter [Acuticoccus sp. MNP-M23]|uniref:ion transporter n=1 Tax=Acuticoccus sp. MNP-M23 TaxID=3072793 RepID=UPI00281534EA|nr:ion transporter [Acuticoccus sp. MNP-M23]WMS41267.1 ion transporter [Acuticoccus sp. MNP-M23]
MFGRRVAFAIQALILISVISVAIETLPDLPDGLRTFLLYEELFVVAVFGTEYALRVYAAPRRLAYIFSFYGVIDALAIAPTILFAGLDLRAMRAVRALRILSLLKMMRYVHAFNRLARSIRSVAPELAVFAFMAGIMLYMCATVVYLFEHTAQPEAFASIPHALWWAVVTFTTVGYGDVYPITAGGRIFTGVILILALGVVAVPTGLIATALTADRERELEEREQARNHPSGEAGASGDSESVKNS